jgi:hypothetical protein
MKNEDGSTSRPYLLSWLVVSLQWPTSLLSENTFTGDIPVTSEATSFQIVLSLQWAAGRVEVLGRLFI